MTTITHPDQIARICEQEADGLMFPRGAHQMLAFCYAMEGVPAYERSLLAKMEEMYRDGYIDDPPPVGGVNLSGMTEIEKKGTCCMIRTSSERLLHGSNGHTSWRNTRR